PRCVERIKVPSAPALSSDFSDRSSHKEPATSAFLSSLSLHMVATWRLRTRTQSEEGPAQDVLTQAETRLHSSRLSHAMSHLCVWA
ncbi:hypothetical protein LEMLEM_LOCUS20198, partial [Lemmus lemmus]